MRSMLELGGSHGIDSIAIVQKNPALKAVVFDKPAVIKTTAEIIAEYEMEKRVTVMGGDYETDPLGSGYDLIYAKATLNLLRDNPVPFFEKVYNALNEGGVFISLHDGLTDEDTKPAGEVIAWLSVGLSSTDLSFSRDVIPNALLAAGFKSVQCSPFSFPPGEELDLVIGRK